MLTDRELLVEAYRAFNARELEPVLAIMHPDVVWPNGMEGGYVHGHDGVREYWIRQWRQIDPHVDPREFVMEKDGRTAIEVYQVVRDLEGNLLMDQMVRHVYRIEGGLIRSMEIEPSEKENA